VTRVERLGLPARPLRIVIDHDAEFTSKTLDRWANKNKVTLHFIRPGWPMENGYESFPSCALNPAANRRPERSHLHGPNQGACSP
jgi:hypothetical protein